MQANQLSSTSCAPNYEPDKLASQTLVDRVLHSASSFEHNAHTKISSNEIGANTNTINKDLREDEVAEADARMEPH